MVNNNYSKIRMIVGIITLAVMITIALSGIFNKFVLAKIWQNENDITTLKVTVGKMEMNIINIDENVKRILRKIK